MGYVAYVGGDAFPDFRFFVPIIPLIIVLAGLSFHELAISREQGFRWKNSIGIVLGMSVLLWSPWVVPGYFQLLKPHPADLGNVKIGLILKQNTPKDTKVADFWAGSVFYFSERYAIDFLGKSDPVIAHLHSVSNGSKPGHNKFDFSYSIGKLRPDIVVANFRLPVSEEKMQSLSKGDWAFTGRLYFDPIFREHCFPYPVPVPTWRTLFVCDWSPLLKQRDRWQMIEPVKSR